MGEETLVFTTYIELEYVTSTFLAVTQKAIAE